MKNVQLRLFDDQVFNEPAKRKSRIDFYDYDGFVEKFKPKKTTDDCYTPEEVYAAVLRFVGGVVDISGKPVVRPFYPGGDYRAYDYPEDCVVIDNPPFSIYAQIIRFYLARGIHFFLFAPHLTMFVKDADCTYVVTGADIKYENGAIVKTSFVTNLIDDLRIWVCSELKDLIEDVQKTGKPIIGKNTYPMNVVSSALLGKMLNRHVGLKVRKEDCVFISNLDSLRRCGKSLFGNGFLLSERAAAERAAAERAAAERAAGVKIELSEREKRIIDSLPKN